MIQNRKQKIEKAFGQKVQSYNEHASLQKEIAVNLCRFLPDESPRNILEIGCGTGFLTQLLRAKYPDSDILSIDITKDMVLFCQDKFVDCPNLSFQVMDGENIILDNKFDLIVSNLSVQWFENPTQGISNLRNYLSDNGSLYFSTIGKNSFQEWTNILSDLNLPSGILHVPDYDGIFKEEEHIVIYKNAIDFLRNFKKTGVHQPHQKYKPLSYKSLQKALSVYDKQHDGDMTWHILYGCFKP